MRNMNSSTKNPGRMYTIKLTGIIPGAGLKTSIYDLKSGKHTVLRDYVKITNNFLFLQSISSSQFLLWFFGVFFFLTGLSSRSIHTLSRRVEGGLSGNQKQPQNIFLYHLTFWWEARWGKQRLREVPWPRNGDFGVLAQCSSPHGLEG